jgi:hypothetical protein
MNNFEKIMLNLSGNLVEDYMLTVSYLLPTLDLTIPENIELEKVLAKAIHNARRDWKRIDRKVKKAAKARVKCS